MNTLELKNSIITTIAQINDEAFLYALRTLIDSKSEDSIYQLNLVQEEKIKYSKQQIESGEFVEHDDLIKQLDKWLLKE